MEIDTQTHHPNPQPQPHHRKIELQSPLDLTYLQQNLAQTALSKLDLHFPPIPKPATVISLDGSQSQIPSTNPPPEIEPDPLRSKVQSLLSTFLLQTWQSAQSNLSLNGLDPTPSTNPIPPSAILNPSPISTDPSSSGLKPDDDAATAAPPPEIEGQTFQFQPFDPRLQSKLASLHSDLEKLTAQVSQLRRTAPRRGADNYTASLDPLLESEDASHREKVSELKSEAQVVFGRGGEAGMRKGWNEDVREMYVRGVEELDSLAGMNDGRNRDWDGDGNRIGNESGKRKRGPSLTETMGKVQRARTVALDMD